MKSLLFRDFIKGEVDTPEHQMSEALKRVKRDPYTRKQIRASLSPQTSTLLEATNTAVHQARIILKGRAYDDIVFIVDNLEKIRRVTGFVEGVDLERELFIEWAPQLTKLAAHFVYTAPLRLLRHHESARLHHQYDGTFVLPMVRVIERYTRTPSVVGLDCLKALLQKRLQDVPLEQAFSPDALDFLMMYSGGHIRSLMMFIKNSCVYADTVPIPLKAAHQAIREVVTAYSTSIPESHWKKLAQLDLSSKGHFFVGDDPDYLMMLDNLSILEYYEGPSEENPFGSGEVWWAVNPIVRELGKFKSAVRELEER